ncbi:DUF3800 domain-containing protein [Rathayibacter sp. VKM Ac-2760]|uniref:DUF3800 domain-containing protein n=1 Tax=Rathayibacter sp. VKM Ac-2760 TaxID=2609253 RepID=UPI001316EA66|nr:DUF3800 domain-containing protein [Rathayibacter sp. VKM Ac-2760]QHC59801.1 DUF3800 domain-containing protein [Rathayibacter sp. VKM Ac-2760]
MFVDESGTPPASDRAADNPVFVLGGIIIPEDVWPLIRGDLERAKAHHHVSGEIKWRYFAPTRPGSKQTSLSHLEAEQRNALRMDLLEAIVLHETVRVIAVVVDTIAIYRSGIVNDADDLYHAAFKRLSERFQYFLQDLTRETSERVHGMIVCDNRNNDQDDRLKEFHQTLLAGGRDMADYQNLIEGLFIAASHQSPGTQFADLVAGAVFRAEGRSDTRFAAILEPSFRRSPSGSIEGYGLVRIPKQ